ncbi:uncharacterized protein [Venturia canescens]|uniref:uncharacterized protein n=1 Tax=Venturia canescens TaxID=32260 RepID=UPI001C9C0365|nr:uncharacterized protein LOC122416754 [Venturia canescens]
MVSLSNIVDETRIGLASIFKVQCHVCQGKIRFTTDKQHQVEKKNVQGKSSNHYDVNTRAAMGALNDGMGSTHINKILASLNIPPFHLNSYKTHEIEVGTAVEEIARDSCIAATFMERELSIQNIDKLKNLLPVHLNIHFLFPTLSEINPIIVNNIQDEDIVRIAASFDMGWTTRGTGRIMIGDNDSSAIASVRAASQHEVIKHSDKNNTSKGVVNELYKIKKNHKELTSVAIKYLQRCFNYCVAQNTDDAVRMAIAIKNIPYHCFNDHKNCGTWCRYSDDPESYAHSAIGHGFQSEQLFDALRCIFDVLASKTDRFAAGVSSNVNESLNSTIASKAPKSRLYGTTSSGDARLACAISLAKIKKDENSNFSFVNRLTTILANSNKCRLGAIGSSEPRLTWIEEVMSGQKICDLSMDDAFL